MSLGFLAGRGDPRTLLWGERTRFDSGCGNERGKVTLYCTGGGGRGPSGSNLCTEARWFLGVPPPLSKPRRVIPSVPHPGLAIQGLSVRVWGGGEEIWERGNGGGGRLLRELQPKLGGERGRPGCIHHRDWRSAGGRRRHPSNRWPLLKIKPRRVVIATTTTAAARGWHKLVQPRDSRFGGRLGARRALAHQGLPWGGTGTANPARPTLPPGPRKKLAEIDP